MYLKCAAAIVGSVANHLLHNFRHFGVGVYRLHAARFGRGAAVEPTNWWQTTARGSRRIATTQQSKQLGPLIQLTFNISTIN